MNPAEIKKTEDRIQQEICMEILNRFCLEHHNPRWIIFSVPNEGKDQKEQTRKKATGLYKGASDLIFIQPERAVFVEVKVPGPHGIQKPDQVKFQQIVEALGFEYFIVRSVDEFYDKVIPEHKPVV